MKSGPQDNCEPSQRKDAAPEILTTAEPGSFTLKETADGDAAANADAVGLGDVDADADADADASETSTYSEKPLLSSSQTLSLPLQPALPNDSRAEKKSAQQTIEPIRKWAPSPMMILFVTMFLLLLIGFPSIYFMRQRLQLEKHFRWSVNQAELHELQLFNHAEAISSYKSAIADAHKLGDSPKVEADLIMRSAALFDFLTDPLPNVTEEVHMLDQAFSIYAHTPNSRAQEIQTGERFSEAINMLRDRQTKEREYAFLPPQRSAPAPIAAQHAELVFMASDYDTFRKMQQSLDQSIQQMGKNPNSYDDRLALANDYFAHKNWRAAIVEYARCQGIKPSEPLRRKLVLAAQLYNLETVVGRDLLLRQCDVTDQMLKIKTDVFGSNKYHLASETRKLAMLYRDASQMEKSEQLFRRVLAWSIGGEAGAPPPIQAYLDLGELLIAEGKFAEAEKLLAAARVERNGEFTQRNILLVRASALVWGGHYTEADKLSALAAKVEGFHPLWKNDTPGYSWENEFGPQRRGAFGGQL